MDAFKKSRKLAKAAITRIRNSVISRIDVETNFFTFQSQLDSLIEKFSAYTDAQNNIEILDTEERDNEDRDEVENNYHELVGILKKRIHELSAPPPNNVVIQNAPNSPVTPKIGVKLPQIAIPCFLGDYQKWTSFYQLFNALIKENSDLDNVQKFIYLKSYLKGEPLSLIDSLEISNTNFPIAINILEKRYENSLAIINAHLNAILDLPNLTKSTSTSLRDFIVNVKKNLESLKNLRCPTEHWDLIIINILLRKLDYGTKKEYQVSREIDKTPTLDEFFKIIELRCNTLESLSSHAIASPEVKRERFIPKFNNKTSLHVSSASSNNFNSRRHCWYCKTPTHDIYKCNTFSKMTIDEKYQYLKSLTLCTNCIGGKHSLSECKSRGCSFCGKNHHTILHRHNISNAFPSNRENISDAPNSRAANIQFQNSENHSSNVHNSTGAKPKTPHHSSGSRAPHSDMDNSSSSQNWRVPTNNQQTIHNKNSVQNKDFDFRESNSSTTSSLFVGKGNPEVLLATAIVAIVSESGQLIKARAVIDNGSQLSFISERILSLLKAKPYRKPLRFSGIEHTTVMSHKMVDVTIHSTTEQHFQLQLSCAVLPTITSNLPRAQLNPHSLNIPADFRLADPDFHISSEIDLLIGADGFYEIILPHIFRLGQGRPTLQLTQFGWIIGGQMPSQVSSHPIEKTMLFCQNQTSDDFIHSFLPKFWEVEHIPETSFISLDAEQAERNFLQSYKRLDNGAFQVDLPLKNPCSQSELGDSFHVAQRRFLLLEKRFQSNPKLFAEYQKFINEYLALKHASFVPFDPKKPNSEFKYFLPHHCVIKESSETTKLRVVFDGSCKTSTNVSLNDILLKGYQVQPELYDILCRFRLHPYVLTCDIEKMYRQVQVNPNQRHLQNILWRNSPTEPLQCLQLSTVTYGVTCSSFLATRVLKELASCYSEQYPFACDALLNQTYVDDILYGCLSLSDLKRSYSELNKLLNSAGLHLHKWSSNSSHFRQLYCERRDSTPIEIEFENIPNKVLGLSWNPTSDQFSISLPRSLCVDNLSKRNALSTIAQMYDPLGFLGPFVVLGKMFMQQLWQSKLSWDAPLNSDLAKEWKIFASSIPLLRGLKIPRFLFTKSTITTLQLHGFSDSSLKAYGACLYVRATYYDNTVSCTLITSKSRVAPLKTISIPRLELNAMVLLTKLTQRILEVFKNKLNFESINLWTDSQVALHWINSHSSRWQTFVANRVSLIQNCSFDASWRHIPSTDNPADILSRGALAPQLMSSDLWWHGPNFLSKATLNLSDFNFKLPVPKTIPEQRSSNLNVFISELSPPQEFWAQLFSKFSQINRLLHTLAYILRFVTNSKRQINKLSGPLTIHETNSALALVLRQIQTQAFSKELSELKTFKPISEKQILSLNPFLNNEGFLCVGGRLHHANISDRHKHPILLPSKHPIVFLLLKQEHIRLGHAGAQCVLSNFRLRYWPLNGLRTIKKVIHECNVCFRFRARPAHQLMANLPRDRVDISRPFQNVGLDFGGPFLVKASRLRKAPVTKCYMAIFVCMATKAVHIELVSSLSTEAFLLTLNRFISRRGIPSTIYSDNGSNFLGARNQLKDLRDFIRNSTVSDQLKIFAAETSFMWKLIPPRSPHWGGIWEAAIKSAKYHLYRLMGNAQFTFEELSTILARIEAILNSRPLCPISNDPTDLQALTPGHFLIGHSMTAYPEHNLVEIPENRLTFWQRCSQIQQSFWKRWSVEYLNRLQSRQKWQYTSKNLEIDTLVLLKEDDVPPLRWPLARVIDIIPSSDNKVRAVKLRTKEGTFIRPITKVCVLPFCY